MLNTFTRQAYKLASGLLPLNIYTQVASTRSTQYLRRNAWSSLSLKPPTSSSHPLDKTAVQALDIQYHPKKTSHVPPSTYANTFCVAPIPWNMHPHYSKARSKAWVDVLSKKHGGNPMTHYTDVAHFALKPTDRVSNGPSRNPTHNPQYIHYI